MIAANTLVEVLESGVLPPNWRNTALEFLGLLA